MSGGPLSPVHFVAQDDCIKHVFCRSKDSSVIFERPERLRFVNLGFAAALAWLSARRPEDRPRLLASSAPAPDGGHPSAQASSDVLLVSPRARCSKSNLNPSLTHPAILAIHDEPNKPPPQLPSSPLERLPFPPNSDALAEPATYLEQIVGLCRRATQLNCLGLSEVPPHLPQSDLYLSAGTEFAVRGAIGACFCAVDSVLRPGLSQESAAAQKAFVNIRPPGHHCTNSEPMGFCWVNNLLISCMYSHLTYGIDRICIVDIDLHHGNGSQEIVWQINERSGQSSVSSNSPGFSSPAETGGASADESTSVSKPRKLKISYSSLHDINSYPCEDGDPDRIRDASLNICVGNAINQFIQNLHLEDWKDEVDFYESVYPNIWPVIERHMLKFFKITEARSDRTLIFVSAGFDACEYESEAMSRYSKNVPASFYNKFSRDIGHFADSHCNGKLISILEGGYSEQTLVGSSLSYILGLMGHFDFETESHEAPWSPSRVGRLLQLCKKTSQARATRSVPSAKLNHQIPENDVDQSDADWVLETRKIFEHMDAYDHLHSSWLKHIKQEEKQAKAQLCLNQLSLAGSNALQGGLRRSHRLVSNSTPALSPTAVDQNIQSDPLCRPPNTAALSAEVHELGASMVSGPTQDPREGSPDVGSDSYFNKLFNKLKLEDQSVPTAPTTSEELAHEEMAAASHADLRSSNQPFDVPRPKLTLTYKAGGIFTPGMASEAHTLQANSTTPIRDPKPDQPNQPSS